MKILAVIKKSFLEQKRNFWVFILIVTMAPFFVFVYYLINETTKPEYNIMICNNDKGVVVNGVKIYYGKKFLNSAKGYISKESEIPFSLKTVKSRSIGILDIKNKKTDVLVIFPEKFSENIQTILSGKKREKINVEFVGDKTNFRYLIAAVWGNAIFENYIYSILEIDKIFNLTETGAGTSDKIREFDVFIPGILILSLIMLMFSASIAFITEVENKTITRLKLSQMTTFEFLIGVSFIQIIIGIISILLTLASALMLGYKIDLYSFIILLFIAVLTSISIIAFSMIIAAATRSANEVLVIGNFPLFLFMFFTGAAFPLKGELLFSVAGYGITLQGLMSPTHAINALNKILIMKMGILDIIPEISVIIFLTIVYFFAGAWFFKQRHMKVV